MRKVLGAGGTLVLLAAAAIAQTNVRQVPLKSKPFDLTTNGSSSWIDNRDAACNAFVATYEIFGGTNTGTVTVRGSLSDGSGQVPGSFSIFPGTPVYGSNPSTASAASILIVGSMPFVDVNVSGLNGQFRGVLSCFASVPEAVGSGGGGGGGNVVITGSACNLQARINETVSGNRQIIPASGSLVPKICFISLQGDTVADISITVGGSPNCAASTATIAGAYRSSFGIFFDRDMSPIAGTAGLGVCVNSSVTQNYGGMVIYRYD